MPRYFTLNQAENLLPKVEPELRRALKLYEQHQGAESQLQDSLRRIAMLGGSMVNREEISGIRERRDDTARELNDTLTEIQDRGCQVKDLQTGLIDFPTLYRDNEVLLCWRFGEKGIHFWHGLEEGFRGRKPIDQEFLDNHRGDRLN